MKKSIIIQLLIVLLSLMSFLFAFSGCDKKTTDSLFDYQVPHDFPSRGDLNINGDPFEIADAVVYSNYFVYGPAAFTINLDSQTIASDVNGDEIPLTVADFVFLIRTINDEIVRWSMMFPQNEVNVRVRNGAISVDAVLGAVAMTFAGHANVSLAASNMEIITVFRDGNTHVLLYSFEKGVFCSGDLLYTDSDLLSFEAAGYYGNSFKSYNISPY